MTSEKAWKKLSRLEGWDDALAKAGGHPLQSVLWGEARRVCDGVDYGCYVMQRNGEWVAQARVEKRIIPLLGSVAWIPRGPVKTVDSGDDNLCDALSDEGFVLQISLPQLPSGVKSDALSRRTIWIDLTIGQEALLKNLDSQWRYGARRALREGVTVGEVSNDAEVEKFYMLCSQVSDAKKFRLPGSLALMQHLLANSNLSSPVCAHLLVARYHGELAAGAFVIVAGKNMHYMWGGVDRRFSKLRAGEAVQWGVIEWALQQGIARYDLEGVDPVRNPGTYEFKKKMGGMEVDLPLEMEVPLHWRGNLASFALKVRARLQS